MAKCYDDHPPDILLDFETVTNTNFFSFQGAIIADFADSSTI